VLRKALQKIVVFDGVFFEMRCDVESWRDDVYRTTPIKDNFLLFQWAFLQYVVFVPG